MEPTESLSGAAATTSPRRIQALFQKPWRASCAKTACLRSVEGGGSRVITYRPKQGQVLLWHENLMHGGRKRKDPTRSRRSIVSHYFAEGAVVYYDSTGLPGGPQGAESRRGLLSRIRQRQPRAR